MDKDLFDFSKTYEEISDVLTNTPSLTALPYEENSPSNANGSDSPSTSVIDGSRRIRKKRNAYHKIDDDTRLQLFEAVQKGETLKSAAKRLNVNYSSAKSIFHIFRKEGRILKKNNNEKDFGYGFGGFGQPEMNMQGHMGMNMNQSYMPHPNMQPGHHHMGGHMVRNPLQETMNRGPHFSHISHGHGHPHMPQQYQRPMYPQQGHPHPHTQISHQHTPQMDRPVDQHQEISTAPSPLTNLADNFNDILNINPNGKTLEDIVKTKNFVPIYQTRSSPRNMSPTSASMNTIPQVPFLAQNSQPSQVPYSDTMPQIILATKPSHTAALVSPVAKNMDNYYLNYSNSPLSGNHRMMKEGSESGSNRYINGEFDSFSEMMNAFQGQGDLLDTITKTPSAGLPKLMTPTLQGDTPKVGIDESPAWGGTIEVAALDTFKSFVDAQSVLTNALKKANMLNNLVMVQKANKMDGSPTAKFMNFQGN